MTSSWFWGCLETERSTNGSLIIFLERNDCYIHLQNLVYSRNVRSAEFGVMKGFVTTTLIILDNYNARLQTLVRYCTWMTSCITAFFLLRLGRTADVSCRLQQARGVFNADRAALPGLFYSLKALGAAFY